MNSGCSLMPSVMPAMRSAGCAYGSSGAPSCGAGADGLGAGAQPRGSEGAEGVDVDAHTIVVRDPLAGTPVAVLEGGHQAVGNLRELVTRAEGTRPPIEDLPDTVWSVWPDCRLPSNIVLFGRHACARRDGDCEWVETSRRRCHVFSAGHPFIPGYAVSAVLSKVGTPVGKRLRRKERSHDMPDTQWR
jgi:hypothetical protein